MFRSLRAITRIKIASRHMWRCIAASNTVSKLSSTLVNGPHRLLKWMSWSAVLRPQILRL